MPQRAARPCPGYGSRRGRCPGLIRGSEKACPACLSFYQAERKQAQRDYDARRDPQVVQWHNSSEYREARKAYLREHPLCVSCQSRGREAPATILDHVIPHKGAAALFWDRNNWQGLCVSCHSIKTAARDGGFGNAKG